VLEGIDRSTGGHCIPLKQLQSLDAILLSSCLRRGLP
jgi:hypothetical protein